MVKFMKECGVVFSLLCCLDAGKVFARSSEEDAYIICYYYKVDLGTYAEIFRSTSTHIQNKGV